MTSFSNLLFLFSFFFYSCFWSAGPPWSSVRSPRLRFMLRSQPVAVTRAWMERLPVFYQGLKTSWDTFEVMLDSPLSPAVGRLQSACPPRTPEGHLSLCFYNLEGLAETFLALVSLTTDIKNLQRLPVD